MGFRKRDVRKDNRSGAAVIMGKPASKLTTVSSVNTAMLSVWNRVSSNREKKKSPRYYIDEFHLLLKEEQTAKYSVEIWKRFRKWGGVPTGITQNVKDLLQSKEVENIFDNSDFVYMLNQAAGDNRLTAITSQICFLV